MAVSLLLAVALTDTDSFGAPANGPATYLTHRVRAGETMMDIARHYDLGFVELRAANPGVDAWLPPVGQDVVLPSLHLEPQAEQQGIVVNLAELRLYYYAEPGELTVTFPIGIGRAGWETPTGITRIVRKRVNPTWVPPASIRAQKPYLLAQVPPGPNNPLGAYALNLGWKKYVIHGTNKPDGIGRRVSSGCLRLYPEDIEKLFAMVEVGTRVTVVDQPIKLGWIGEKLFMEVHPSHSQGEDLEFSGRFGWEPLPSLYSTIGDYPGVELAEIDWERVEQVARERRGLPVQISR